MAPDVFKPETVAVVDLVNHPRNYQDHSNAQIQHLKASITEHGFYRNIIIARGNVILAGHGVVAATKELGIETIPVIKLDIDPYSVAALRVLVSDNEISRMSDPNDHQLLELLKSITTDSDLGLIGTGINPEELEALAMLTAEETSFDSDWITENSEESSNHSMAENGEEMSNDDFSAPSLNQGPVTTVVLTLTIHITEEGGLTDLCDRLEVAEPMVIGKSANLRWPAAG
jgi:hypothetical protein